MVTKNLENFKLSMEWPKSVTAKVKKVEIELAASLWRHCSRATVNHPRETIKRHWKINTLL